MEINGKVVSHIVDTDDVKIFDTDKLHPELEDTIHICFTDGTAISIYAKYDWSLGEPHLAFNCF